MTEKLVRLELIEDNPYQQRKLYQPEKVENIGRSIASDGLEQTPKARLMPDGSYQLKFGHTRRESFRWLKANWTALGLTNRYDAYNEMPLNVEDITDEEMARGAIIENEHRADITVIEKANEMELLRKKFDYSSAKIGDLFGMNDATVRGIIYMLALPKKWQDALSDGKISQGDARMGLSLQKLVSPKIMNETISEILKMDGTETPEYIMDEVIEELHSIKQMWGDGNKSEKPRADWRNSWLLVMKNFPNKLLAELTVEEAADAIGDLDAKDIALINTWLMFSLGRLDKEIYSQEALEKAIPAEWLARLRHLLNPTSCATCPFYAKIKKHHYCGMTICHQRKTHAWRAEILRAASKDLGIPVYEEADGKYLVLSYDSKSTALFDKRNKDLRLMPKGKINGYIYQNYKGVNDDVFAVVITGDAASKLQTQTMQQGTKLKGNAIDRTAQRKAKIFMVKRKELMWEFCLSAKSMFDGLTLTVLTELNDWKYLGVDHRPLKDEDGEDVKENVDEAEHLRCMLVWRMIIESANFTGSLEMSEKTPMIAVAEALAELAKEWGIKAMMKLTKMAEDADVEIDSVSVETKPKKKE